MQYQGIITITKFGTGYVNCSDKSSILIPKENINFAINGDTVDVEIISENEKGKIGKIISMPSFIGKKYIAIVHHFHKGNIFAYVEEIGKKNLICVKYKNKNKVSIGDYLYIEITDVNNGIVNSYIGKFGNECFEKKFNLIDTNFDIKCNTLLNTVNRVDLTSHDVFTIDPIGSKDLDDAFSIIYEFGKGYHIYIHIADVSEYIYPGMSSFEDIMKKGNTIYGINRNWTMLPRTLSDDLCSLIPGHKRFAITNEFIFNGESLQHVGMFYSIIESKKQYTYEDIDILLNNNTVQNIIILNDASLLINNILSMFPINLSSSTPSHKMVELFMLLTNKVMGEFLYNKNKGNFRFHPQPYTNQLQLLIKLFNMISSNPSRNEILEKCLENKELLMNPMYDYIVKDIMRKAQYVPYNKPHSHYALGIENYIHFTSPIRRASDLLNHLMIKEYAFTDDEIEKYCTYFNDAEYIQVNVENMISKYNSYMNMLNLVDTVIECYIISVRKTGISIYICNIEHDIHISQLSKEKLLFDNDNQTLKNDMYSYKLFDKINVMMEDVDIIKHEIIVRVNL